MEDPALDVNEIRLDQTLRNALGIPYEKGRHERDDLKLFPLVLGWKQKILSFITGFLGRRYLFLRVAKHYPPDLEKNICRLSKDALALLGTSEGNRIVLVSCIEKDTEIYTLKNCSIKAFDLGEDMLERRKQEEQNGLKDKWSARYVNASKLHEVEPDISHILLDLHIRNELKIEPGDPVKVRRDFKDLFIHQLLEGGIILAISVIALTGLLPSDLKEQNYSLFLAIAGLSSVVFACLVTIFRLWSRIR